MTILLCDPQVAAVPITDNGEPLVRLDRALSPARAPGLRVVDVGAVAA